MKVTANQIKNAQIDLQIVMIEFDSKQTPEAKRGYIKHVASTIAKVEKVLASEYTKANESRITKLQNDFSLLQKWVSNL